MSKSQTTNRPYYFARRKDTGMMGVWFTHCARDWQRDFIIDRLIDKAKKTEDMVIISLNGHDDTRFRVCFLEENFVQTVRDYTKMWGISVAHELTLAVIHEHHPEITRIP
ncbi:MAG: hypothetical protein ACRCW3_00235 [Metamycoplasmataceae bacterium]